MLNWVQPTHEDEQTTVDDNEPKSHDRYDYRDDEQKYEQEENEEENQRQSSQPQELLIDFVDDPIPPVNQTKKTSSVGYGALGGNNNTTTSTSNDGWDSWGAGDGWGGDDWESNGKKE